MPLVMGVDSSTQSTKLEVRDTDTGRVVAQGQAPHPATQPPRSEQDPAAWWDALTRAATAARPPASPIAALAIAGQQHGLVALDDRAQVIRPAKLWNDTESAAEATALVERLGPQAWADACGSVPVAAFTISKLAWLAAHEPAHFARVATVLLPHDWLTSRVTGGFTTDRGDASGTGYWSPARGAWDPELLALIDGTADAWPARLPAVLEPLELAGPVRRAPAADLGLASDAVVAAGTGDNMAAAVGLALTAGDVVISLGTSGTVYAVADAPTADASGAVAGFADATGRYLPLVCTMNATQVTDAVARLLGVDLGELDRLALAAAAGAGGLVLVPYLNGERTPNRPDATGLLSGIRTDVSRGQLARAAFEGVICGLLDGVDALAAAGVRTDGRLLLIGGGSRSAAYRQVLADLTDRVVTVPAEAQLVAAGACVQAAAALTQSPLIDVARAWGLTDGRATEPRSGIDIGAIRGAYASAASTVS